VETACEELRTTLGGKEIRKKKEKPIDRKKGKAGADEGLKEKEERKESQLGKETGKKGDLQEELPHIWGPQSGPELEPRQT